MWPVNGECLFPAQQSHACNQTDQPEIMVTMQVGNENMVDFTPAYFISGYLHLGTFTTINQENLVV